MAADEEARGSTGEHPPPTSDAQPRTKKQKREGFSTVTPYLVIRDAVAAIEVYKKARWDY